ncbi:MAG: hypothetical protein QNJ53_28615 [Pleurocapsa sp. MO_192.B19]|nr:hypothetical protein [Pleurocapsa sp. MO_192.B19]
MKFEDQLFREAELSWDLEKLYERLTQAKQLSTSHLRTITGAG